MPATSTKNKPRRSFTPEVQAARNIVRRRGWTHAQIADLLGVTRTHISYVLNGRRISQRVLTFIDQLPDNPKPA